MRSKTYMRNKFDRRSREKCKNFGYLVKIDWILENIFWRMNIRISRRTSSSNTRSVARKYFHSDWLYSRKFASKKENTILEISEYPSQRNQERKGISFIEISIISIIKYSPSIVHTQNFISSFRFDNHFLRFDLSIVRKYSEKQVRYFRVVRLNSIFLPQLPWARPLWLAK